MDEDVGVDEDQHFPAGAHGARVAGRRGAAADRLVDHQNLLGRIGG